MISLCCGAGQRPRLLAPLCRRCCREREHTNSPSRAFTRSSCRTCKFPTAPRMRFFCKTEKWIACLGVFWFFFFDFKKSL